MADFNIKPLEDRIVVKPLEAEQTTASGLVIPDTAKEKPQEGEVLAVGPGRIDDNGNRVPLDVAVGDKVIYSKYGGTEVKYGGDDYLILSARDVLAVVSSNAPVGRVLRAPRPRAADPIHLMKEASCSRSWSSTRRTPLPGARRRRAGRRGEGDARAQGPQRRPRQEVGRAHDHQRRRDDRQ